MTDALGGYDENWIQQTVEALKLRRDFPDASASAIAQELQQMLIYAGKPTPSLSTLRKLVANVDAYLRQP